MSKNSAQTYYSKVSYPLLGFIFLVFFGPLIPVGSKRGIDQSFVFVVLGLVIFYGLILHLFYSTKYVIQGDQLKVFSGFIRFKPIDIQAIKKIEKTFNIISAPAASLDRIEVSYGRFDSLIISPKDKAGFAQALVEINPYITVKL
jgi:hypothetical protein